MIFEDTEEVMVVATTKMEGLSDKNTGFTVLLIDDNPSDVFLFKAMLKNIKFVKFQIRSVARLSEGIKLLQERKFDAILLDLSLPDAIGPFEGFDQLSQETDIPIIVVTGLDDEETAMNLVQKGAQDYLVKGHANEKHLYNSIRYAIERSKAQKARYEFERRRSQFVTIVSHELRTPIHVLRGYIDFIGQMFTNQNDDTDNSRILETIRNCLPKLKRNISRLENLATGVTDISKIRNGVFPVSMSFDIFDYNEFLAEALSTWKDILGDHLNVKVLPSNTMVRGDTSRIQQVIDNLLDNAIKNTDETERKIDVETVLQGKHTVRTTIMDNGAGILKDNFENIFQQFVSIPTVYSVVGSGIGLFLSREIVRAHHGNLSVNSKGLETGSTFILDLPTYHGHD